MRSNITFMLAIIVILFSNTIFSQGYPNYKGGLKIKLDEDGEKYLRTILWGQMQTSYDKNADKEVDKLSFSLRRIRVIMYSQMSDDFLILTHFGLNNMNADNISPTGKSESSQLFLHDAWVQYRLYKTHHIGFGLHYFNGISRLNNQSTLNFLTLDNNRQSWSTLGLSDQFARHLGMFFKGTFGKLRYQLAINESITNTLDIRDVTKVKDTVIYSGRKSLGSASSGKNYAGYFSYNIFDKESDFLPFRVGSYLGEKRIFNVGAGFFYHPKGSAISKVGTKEITGVDVSIFAIDTFLDFPLGSNNSAITFYGVFQKNNYGRNYLYSAYGTGSMIYGHIGYLLPRENKNNKLQPYISFANNNYDASFDSKNILGIGLNYYMSGHHSKLTLEYKNQTFGSEEHNVITLQAMIYI